MPPAHVIVGKRSRTKYKKDRKYDGRTKAGRKLVSRVLLNRNKKMSEELTKLPRPTETERAQKQIAQQQKKLGRQKELQKKR